jgi:uncharacterized protein YwgA
MAEYNLHEQAAVIIQEAGGELVGRTRLQKVTYLAQLAGFGSSFSFEYKHYGPFSEELATAIEIAAGVGFISEDEKRTDWGGWYSVYSVSNLPPTVSVNAERAKFISAAAKMSAVELELAATAAFLFREEGNSNPWTTTAQLKPDKASGGRLERAKTAYRELSARATPEALPQIA